MGDQYCICYTSVGRMVGLLKCPSCGKPIDPADYKSEYCECEEPRGCVGGLPAERCWHCQKPFKPVDMEALSKALRGLCPSCKGDFNTDCACQPWKA